MDIKKIPKLDALFIRANTDPMNTTYVAAKMASMYGIPVIDDPASIQICADKINMYMHLMKNECLHAQDQVPEEEGAGRDRRPRSSSRSWARLWF